MPAVKAILPHVGTIIAAAKPVFRTRKVDENAATQAHVLQEQITELQNVTSNNVIMMQDLALQLKQTLTSIEQAASLVEARFRRQAFLSASAMLISVVAIAFSAAALLGV